MKKKIGVCGNFSGKTPKMGGQTVKTHNTYRALEETYGAENICCVNTYDWKKKHVSGMMGVVKLFTQCENIIMLPAENGLKVFSILFSALNLIFKRNLYYVVIGGWLPSFISKNMYLLNKLKNFKGIYVETQSMVDALNKIGLDRVKIIPNFKYIEILNVDKVEQHTVPLKLCTMSRVMPEKGIERAIKATIQANNELGKIGYSLDIYGQVSADYEKKFESLIKNSPEYIRYAGVVSSNETVKYLKDYYLLLFPTYYSGEGFPGTFLDSFAAGVPVIATDWKYNKELVPEECGYIYTETEILSEILVDFFSRNINSMKKACHREAIKYIPKNAIKPLVEDIHNEYENSSL